MADNKLFYWPQVDGQRGCGDEVIENVVTADAVMR